jgi:cyanophycinase
MRTLVVLGIVLVMPGSLLPAKNSREQGLSSIRVGPERGTIIAVGGGNRPEILARFIEAAGGFDAAIIYVPTAGLTPPGEPQLTRSDGDSTEATFRAAGAKNVVVLHTFDHAMANSPSFVEPITHAGGVWFSGGRPERLMNTYADTRTEREIRGVLDRGGVVGGTSAGAVVLGSDFVSNSMSEIPIEDRPSQPGFGFLRAVAVQPHTRRAEPRSWTLKRPDLLGIAMEETTGWFVRGDMAEVVGTGNAYVFDHNANKPGESFITLRVGDSYNLATRIMRRVDSR